LVLILLLVYMVMASLYEAFLQPFGIMLTIPLAVIGIVLSLILTGTTLSLSSFIGILMVVGIVTKNGIILVDYIDKLRAGGMDRNQAIVTGGSIRLRPILMTALATMFGCIPMALSHGEGSELFAPIGITVLGGLTTSTFLTLLIMPALYSMLDDFALRLRGKWESIMHKIG
jgi:hydrophobic/amphiphilic exporter-1 (mainly G- bacteria), HAE1 family